MRTLAALSCCIALAAFLPATRAIEVPNDPGGSWTLAQSTANDRVALREWVRPGDTLVDWRELFSTLEVRQISSPLEVAEDTRARIRRLCPAADWRYVRQLPDDVLYVSDSGRCSDGSGPEVEVARLTRMPGTRTYKVSWSYRGADGVSKRGFWIRALDRPLATWEGRAALDDEGAATPRTVARAEAPIDAATGGRRGDTDAELERCKASSDPFGCIARIQERLLAEGGAAAADNARLAGSARPATAARPRDVDAEIERCKASANPTACLNRLQEHLLAEDSKVSGAVAPGPRVGAFAPGIASVRTHDANPSGGPAAPNDRFKTTATQIYAVVVFEGDQSGRSLEFDWRYLSGPGGEQSLTRRAMTIEGRGGRAWAALTSMQLMPEGDYRVDVYLDGRLAGQAHFTVVRAGTFG